MNKTSKVLLSTFIIIAVVCSFSIVHADLIDPGTRHTSNDYLDVEETEVGEEVENVTSEQHSELISTLEDEVEGEEPHDELITPHEEETTQATDLISPAEPEVEEGKIIENNMMAISGIGVLVIVVISFILALRVKDKAPSPVEEATVGAKPEEPVEEELTEETKEEEKEEDNDEKN